ncbi:MAG: hypothetical protein Ct9H300mP21_06920 [Pseudomonadota bacterium]|nr:MAG: hypothetical protein Ct9H300mP21_06920 [Pseudomonadota bacterium]
MNPHAIQQKVLENLASEKLSGLGISSLYLPKDILTTTTWHNRGGFTCDSYGTTGTPRGFLKFKPGEGPGSWCLFSF